MLFSICRSALVDLQDSHLELTCSFKHYTHKNPFFKNKSKNLLKLIHQRLSKEICSNSKTFVHLPTPIFFFLFFLIKPHKSISISETKLTLYLTKKKRIFPSPLFVGDQTTNFAFYPHFYDFFFLSGVRVPTRWCTFSQKSHI